MVLVNENYLKLKAGYLFPEIGRRVREFQQKNPKAKIIRLGIGDVTLPLPQAVIEAFHQGVDEMGSLETFRGYGPEQGYSFLAESILEHDYRARGISLECDEIFISDGSKCDTGNIQEIFGLKNKIAVSDPVYPVYVDTNIMAGRSEQLVYMPCTEENNFVPDLPHQKVDLIYLCFPNNPTGAVASRAILQKWVDYALANQSIILFDAAYEAFITDLALPHSIYEIPNAKKVAIEFRSFSKTAGFTGTRCAFTIVPKELMGKDTQGNPVAINPLWLRRQTTKFNGVSYPVQKAAAACYSVEGQKQIRELIQYYMENARMIRHSLENLGYKVFGGVNAPYIWLQTPGKKDSWEFFDQLLTQAHVVGTPGSGFGSAGQGYFRLSAFGSKENVEEALMRFSSF